MKSPLVAPMRGTSVPAAPSTAPEPDSGDQAIELGAWSSKPCIADQFDNPKWVHTVRYLPDRFFYFKLPTDIEKLNELLEKAHGESPSLKIKRVFEPERVDGTADMVVMVLAFPVEYRHFVIKQ